MRLVTYQLPVGNSHDSNLSSVGVLVEGVTLDANAILRSVASAGGGRRVGTFGSVEDVLLAGALEDLSCATAWFRERYEAGSASWQQAEGPPVDALDLLSPVLKPSKVIGIGVNYRSFAAQNGSGVPEHPHLFHKTASALTGAGKPIVIPNNADPVVPEGELAVLIGRRTRRIRADHASACIAGYACVNDVTARNLEFQTSQWTNGKMLPTFAPLGPALVTPDEVPHISQARVQTILNGKIVQEGSTRDMIFGVPELISEISARVDLEVGDVVLTGTPSDLGAQDPPIALVAGDIVKVVVSGVGRLENQVAAVDPNPQNRGPALRRRP